MARLSPPSPTLSLAFALLAAAAVGCTTQDASTNSGRVRGKAVLAVLLARDVAFAVAALLEGERALGVRIDCWGA